MSGAEARRAAADLLFLSLEKRRTLDQAMAESTPFSDLDGSDRAFARAIASAALRELGRIGSLQRDARAPVAAFIQVFH